MSRSYKKNPWITDHQAKTTSNDKKFANKKVRHAEDLPNGGAFKKVSCSYDICDFKFFQTKEEAIAEYEKIVNDVSINEEYRKDFLKEFPTLKAWLWNWKKYYIRK